MLATIQICSSAFAAGLRPEPDLTVSEWADANRILVSKSSAETGQYRTDRTPYVREIVDCCSASSPVEQVTVMKGAQLGLSEGGTNFAGYVIHHAPGPMLIVVPTLSGAKKFSKTRLAPMIEACPALRERMGSARDSGNTVLEKDFPGGVISMTGANSAAGLRSMSARFLLEDEVDAFPSDVEEEGDPLELAEVRTSSFRNRKIFRISTPTLLGASAIHTKYREGDQRGYFVPCPFCEAPQVLTWRKGDDIPGGLVWPAGRPEEARYQCESCTKLIDEWQKTAMLARGEWRARAVCDPKIRSYHLSSLYSPYGWVDAAWPTLAAKWIRVHKDPSKLKVFINTKLGEPFEDRSAQKLDEDVLLNRCETYGAEVPAAVAVLTAGADVQGDRIECEVKGWGAGEESWSIGYYVIPGDTAKPDVWNQFDALLRSEFDHQSGLKFTIRATGIDSQFYTETVATFCANRFNRRIWAVRGKPGKVPVWPQKPGKTKKTKSPVFSIGVDAAKEITYARLKIGEPGPGYYHFPLFEEQRSTSRPRDRQYFEQLTAEVCVPIHGTNPPRWQWKKKVGQERNEVLDCNVYAYAALCGLKASGLRLDVEAERVRKHVEARKADPESAPMVLVARANNRQIVPPNQRIGRSNW